MGGGAGSVFKGSQEPLKAKKLDRNVIIIETAREGGQEEDETHREVESYEI